MEVVERGHARFRQAILRPKGQLTGQTTHGPRARGDHDGPDAVRHRVPGEDQHRPLATRRGRPPDLASRPLVERRRSSGPPRLTGWKRVRKHGPHHAATITRGFQDALDRAELPDVRFHDLRHSAATFLLAQGMTLEDVKNQLGHSTIVLTSNTYGHVLEQRRRQVAAAMDAVLGR